MAINPPRREAYLRPITAESIREVDLKNGIVQEFTGPFTLVADYPEPQVVTAEEIQADLMGRVRADIAAEQELAGTEEPLEVRRGRRALALGFVSMKNAEDVRRWDENQGKTIEREHLRMHYATYYPQNTFITEENVEALCSKYGLVHGAIDRYSGEIPDRSLGEMEKFAVRDEDVPGAVNRSWEIIAPEEEMTPVPDRMNITFEVDTFQAVYDRALRESTREWLLRTSGVSTQSGMARRLPNHTSSMSEYQRWLVEDPIVLQPVKGGYLIVTAWGDEASDELVVNPNRN